MNQRVGLTKDAGWQVGVSRTVHHPLEAVWELLVSAEGLALWLGEDTALEPGAAYTTPDGTTGEVRSFHEHDRIRLTWQPPGWTHDSTVQVALTAVATGTRIVFHQERLAGPDERDEQRDHWRGVADALEARLDAKWKGDR